MEDKYPLKLLTTPYTVIFPSLHKICILGYLTLTILPDEFYLCQSDISPH